MNNYFGVSRELSLQCVSLEIMEEQINYMYLLWAQDERFVNQRCFLNLEHERSEAQSTSECMI